MLSWRLGPRVLIFEANVGQNGKRLRILILYPNFRGDFTRTRNLDQISQIRDLFLRPWHRDHEEELKRLLSQILHPPPPPSIYSATFSISTSPPYWLTRSLLSKIWFAGWWSTWIRRLKCSPTMHTTSRYVLIILGVVVSLIHTAHDLPRHIWLLTDILTLHADFHPQRLRPCNIYIKNHWKIHTLVPTFSHWRRLLRFSWKSPTPLRCERYERFPSKRHLCHLSQELGPGWHDQGSEVDWRQV